VAAYATSRFEIYRWDADSDTFTRSQMNTSHAQLEDLAAKILEGNIAPSSSGPSVEKTFYFDTAANALYYYDGTWNRVNPAFGTPVSTGTANAQGSAATVARSDHVHSIGNNTLTTAKFNASVAGAGLSVNDTAMSVNVDDSTLQINSDTLRVKNGGIQQVHTDTASRLIHMSPGTADPVAPAAEGDLNIRKGNKQLYYYTAADGWGDYNLVKRMHAIKVSWTTSFSSQTSANAYLYNKAIINVPWTACAFPSIDLPAERNRWSPTGDFANDTLTAPPYTSLGGTDAYGRVLKFPWTGFYSITADVAFEGGRGGARGISVWTKGATGDFVQLPGGTTTLDIPDPPLGQGNQSPINAEIGDNYVRLLTTVFHAATEGDLVRVRIFYDGAQGGPGNPVVVQGANMTIKFESAL
jgi:hypothetical protein